MRSAAEARSNQRNAVIAGFLGWTLDAFDFFVLTFVLVPIAHDFHRSVPAIALAITASLATRPLGAILFGLLADRYGRRLPLMLDILLYSGVEVLSGLAPNYATFLILRLIYGIGMGGEWGVGASLAMESVPANWRGVLSGFLQEGYAFGYLLAAVAYWTAFPHWGWRSLFFIGGAPALLTLFIRAKVKESEAWSALKAERHDWREYGRDVIANSRRFFYLVLLMAMMNFMSHGTQDIYPTYLQQQRGFTPKVTAVIAIISMIGAILGGLVVGLLSDRWGRRRAMVASALVGTLLIPLWVLAPGVSWIVAGAFLMQFMVQGAWGVIPAHINELAPDRLRGFFPGFAYQVGVLIAASSAYIEARMSQRLGYGPAMAIFAGAALVIGAAVIALGPEAHRVAFGGTTRTRQ
ncbi:MAG TPA: MFS transporter [Candidatus Acidoferrales bacterium]|nr:MFS transporter [Candidatus Acidoferrales bacterium]